MLELRMDVLHLDGRFIDQDADGQRQPAQRHEVDRVPRQPQGEDAAQQRQRDVEDDDHHAPPIAQEEHDHQARQDGPQQRFQPHALHGAGDVGRLVELEADLDALVQGVLHPRQVGLHLVDHAQRRGVGPLGDEDVNRALAVHQAVAAGNVGAILHPADVAQVHGRAAAGPDDDALQLLRLRHHRVHCHHRLLVAEREGA